MTRTAFFFSVLAGLAGFAVWAHHGPTSEPEPHGGPGLEGGAEALTHGRSTATRDGVTLELRVANGRWGKVTVSAAETAPGTEAQGVDLVVVLDRSGSMAGQKWLDATQAVAHLVSGSPETDRLTLISFASETSVSGPTPADAQGKHAMRVALDSLRAEGGTDLGAALSRVAELPGASGLRRRVVLVSDGVASIGETSRGVLVDRVAQLRAQGLAFTALGVGLDFDAALLREMVGVGGGYFAFLEQGAALGGILAKERALARRASVRSPVLSLGTSVEAVIGRGARRAGFGWEVPLPDLAPGDSATVYVRFAEGSHPFGLGDAAVAWSGGQQVVVHQVKTERAPAAASELEAECLRAMSSEQMSTATQALDRGDRAGALAQLDLATHTLERSGHPLARAEAKALRTLADEWRTQNEEAVRRSRLGLTKKAMQNFGENNAY